MRSVGLVMLAGLVGCQTASSPRAVPLADPKREFKFELVEQQPCSWTRERRGPDPRFASECGRLSGPLRWHGTWSVESEGSDFMPEGGLTCPRSLSSPCSIAIEGKALPWPGRWACPRHFKIEFIGRRSLLPGPYGSFGMTQYRIVVDRLISAKRLPDEQKYDPRECDAS